MKMEKLILLGHSDGGVSTVMENAFQIFGCQVFDIIKNIDRPDCMFLSHLFKTTHFFDHEYSFDPKRDFPVQFGVHHGNVKYLLYHHFKKNYQIKREQYISLIHHTADFAPSASSEEGLLMEPLSLVSSMAKLGFGVTLKRGASVGHHAVLEDFATLNPGAVLAGFVTIGEGSEIGVGAIVSNNVKIGKRCLIGAGSVVTKDIPDGMIAYGNPCRVVRENERWSKISISN